MQKGSNGIYKARSRSLARNNRPLRAMLIEFRPSEGEKKRERGGGERNTTGVAYVCIYARRRYKSGERERVKTKMQRRERKREERGIRW